MARLHDLVYTRYVDDITLSGNFDLRRSGFPAVIKSILDTNGFSTNDAKDQFGRIGDAEFEITKLRANRGHLDVSRKYLDDLCCRLRELQTLGEGGEFAGAYYTRGQMWGRVEFVSWVNPGRRRQLRNLFNSVPWKKAADEAKKRSLVVCKKSLGPIRRDEPDGWALAVGQ